MTMKAQESPKQKRRSRSGKKSPTQRPAIRKSSTEKKERQQTLDKLRQMVGGDEGCSQLEIMQHVIDHIWQLQRELYQPTHCDDDSAQQRQSQSPNQLPNKENIEGGAIQQLNRQLAKMLKS